MSQHVQQQPFITRKGGKGRSIRWQPIPPPTNKQCLRNNPALGTSLLMRNGIGRRNLPIALKEEPGIAIPTELELAFRVHHGMVFRTAYRITGNAADAEDVLQVVFLRLLRRDTHAEALDNHESYLRRAAINASLDVIRARQADRTVELTTDFPREETPELTAGSRLELWHCSSRGRQKSSPLRFLEGFTNSADREKCWAFPRCWWRSSSIAHANSSARSSAAT
jgi:hypothetical protein